MAVQNLDSLLLARCLRRGAVTDVAVELGGLDDHSWRRLVDEAIWLGVAPQLHFRLGRLDDVVVPPDEAMRLRDVYLHCLLKNEAILEQLSEILEEIRGAGQSVLVLKGAYLANCVYEEPALRPMTDIDLLARTGEAESVQQTLATLGYRQAQYPESLDFSKLHHLTPMSKPGLVEVEVHHGLAPKGAPFEHDAEGLWDRSMVTSVGDSLLLRHPAPDDVLLHLCAHSAYNDRFRMGLPAACDIDAVVRRLGDDVDWERLVLTANSDGRARFAFVALSLARVLLETDVPESALASLAHNRVDTDLVDQAVAYALSTAHEAPVTVRAMGEAKTLQSKLVRLWRGILPPPDTLRRNLGLRPGTKVGPHLYVARLSDLVRRRGSQVLRLVAGTITGSSKTRPERDKERRRRMIREWALGDEPPTT